jgi:hypothetical protein
MSTLTETTQICFILLAAVMVAALTPAVGYSQAADPGPPPVTTLSYLDSAQEGSLHLQLSQRLSGRIAWGEDVINNNLVSFDLVVPGSLNSVAGLALDSRGIEIIGIDSTWLYLMTAGGDLYRVSSSDGSYTLIGNAELGATNEISDLASDPITGNLYAVTTNCWDSSSLYTIDPATAEATLIGSIGTNCMVALAADRAGTLFGYDIEVDRLYTVQKTNALAIDAGELGFDANYSQGMDCDPVTDMCYLFAFNDGMGRAELWKFDPDTVALSEVGVLGATTPVGMVSLGDAVIIGPMIFADGFESGNTSAWSSTVP